LKEETLSLFESLEIMSKREQEARYDIFQENYKMKIQIESRVMADMALNHIIPAAIKYQSQVVDNVRGLKDIFAGEFDSVAKEQIAIIKELSDRIELVRSKAMAMTEARKQANKIEDPAEQAKSYCDTVVPFFEEIRYQVDKLELVIDNNDWPLPKYREMLFTK
jgi:glutamine synthetase